MTFRPTLFALAAALLLAACAPNDTERAPTDDLGEQAAFILGHELGMAFHQQQDQLEEAGFRLNEDVVRAGFRAGLRGDTLPYSDEEVQRIMMAFQDSVMAQAGAGARAEGETFRQQFSQQQNVQQTESGLLIRTIREGTGESPRLQDQVVIHYEGRRADGQVFDSSFERGEPTGFPLQGVIPGFTEGLQQMRAGGEYELVIPPHLGYGDNAPPVIGPGQTLVFRIELLEVIRG